LPKPVLSLLRVRRMANGDTIESAARKAGINATDMGRVERLQQAPSRRVADYLASVHRTPIERLLSPVKV